MIFASTFPRRRAIRCTLARQNFENNFFSLYYQKIKSHNVFHFYLSVVSEKVFQKRLAPLSAFKRDIDCQYRELLIRS